MNTQELMNEEFRLTTIYMENKSVENWDKLSKFRKDLSLFEKEILTAEERDIINSLNQEWVKEYLFHHSWNNTYLNLEVYSEVEHDKRQFEMELGYSLKDLDVEECSMYQDWEKEQYLKEEFGGTW
jgi:hypothetical protein